MFEHLSDERVQDLFSRVAHAQANGYLGHIAKQNDGGFERIAEPIPSVSSPWRTIVDQSRQYAMRSTAVTMILLAAEEKERSCTRFIYSTTVGSAICGIAGGVMAYMSKDEPDHEFDSVAPESFAKTMADPALGLAILFAGVAAIAKWGSRHAARCEVARLRQCEALYVKNVAMMEVVIDEKEKTDEAAAPSLAVG